MLESRTVAVAQVAGSEPFTLVQRGGDWVVRVGGLTLMSIRMHDSEESLAEEALRRAAGARAVLIGGLGLGFTLRAVLDRVGSETKVVVAELVPELVEWNRTHLAGLHGHALDDPRCRVIVGDVLQTIQHPPHLFDALLLDVDNGPVALSHDDNQRLYSERGVRQCRAALRPGGVLAVWSAGSSPAFEQRLGAAGLAVETKRVAARRGSGGRHVIFLGINADPRPAPRPKRR
jgi:spermidine synthase